MKIFEVLRAGWDSLDEEGRRKVIAQVTPSEMVREIIYRFEEQVSDRPHEPEDTLEDTIDEDDDDIIDAEFVETKSGFGA